ncbi:conjugal transfer protein [Rahnella sp. AA]|uniref:type IV conjugative transfer system pilin TraA n=1 Tax=Rahnella sp. AA TaxID=2057180 RepID=UPI000C3457A8|nr:type IV conjugative transfer system pilin TraA [Rahnella sp. AA]PKE27623.1 conjugal transfer protein [Rahnella sp. AA]
MKSVITEPGISGGLAVALSEDENKRQKGLIGYLNTNLRLFYFRRIKRLIPQSPAAQRSLIYFTLALAIIVFPHLVRATDLMANQKTDASDTFGHNSTVEWALYVAEIIVSVVGFIKTRNPMIFSGLIILMIITRAFFALIG